MVRVINPYATERPIGQMIAQIGQQLFGDQAGAQLAREQAYAASRANAETDNLMRWAATGQNLNNLSPEAAAMLIGSGYDPNDLGRIGSLYASTNLGPRAPETTGWLTGLGEYRNTAQAFDLDLAEVARANDMASADRRYDVDQNVAEDARQFNMTPTEALVNGQPAFVPRSGAFDAGVAPVLSETDVLGTELQRLFPTLTPEQQRTAVGAAPSLDQVRAGVATEALGTEAGLGGLDPNTQAFVGADPSAGGGTPRNYIDPDGTVHITYDGITDAQTGTPLAPGGQLVSTSLQGGAADIGLTNAGLTDNQADVISAEKFNAIVDMALPLTEDPTLFGPVGFIRSKAQELIATVNAVVGAVAPETPVFDQVTGEQTGTIASLIPEMFDPRLSEVETLWGVLLYQGASALAGQENRSVSDQDVRAMRGILGSPMALFSSNTSMRAKLLQAQAVVNALANVSRNALANGVNTAPAPVAPAAAPAPNLTPNPDGTFTWTP